MRKFLPIVLLLLCACGDPPNGLQPNLSKNMQDTATGDLSPAVAPANLRQPNAGNVAICTKDQAFTLSTSAIHFGKVGLGKHQARSVQLSYAGNCAMPITLSLTGSARFSVKILGQTLLTDHSQAAFNLPGQKLEIYVQFTPSTAAPQAGELRISAGKLVQTLNLDGNPADATKPDPPPDPPLVACIALESPTQIDFGSVVKGKQAWININVSSCGNAPLVVTGIALTTASAQGQFSFDFSEFMVDPQINCTAVDQKNGPSPLKTCVIPAGKVATFLAIYAPTHVSPPSDVKNPKSPPIADTAVVSILSNADHVAKFTMKGVGLAPPPPVVQVACAAVAKVKQGQAVIPQTLLELDAAASVPPTGSTITTYKWSVKQPLGSNQPLLPSPDVANPTLQANVVGTYTFCLSVWSSDGSKSCKDACIDVYVFPANAIHVELLWDTPADADQTDWQGADVDLHFGHLPGKGPDLDCDSQPDVWFDNSADCFWFAKAPTWGPVDSKAADDPTLDLDDTTGAGPENLNVDQPEIGAGYAIGVHYWDDHKMGTSLATVSIFIQGNLVNKIEKTPMDRADMWYVGKLNWPNTLVGGTLPPLQLCYQSGDVCMGAKMWQATGDLCMTHCYVNKTFYGLTDTTIPPQCK